MKDYDQITGNNVKRKCFASAIFPLIFRGPFTGFPAIKLKIYLKNPHFCFVVSYHSFFKSLETQFVGRIVSRRH